ncbi:hypothetical protein OSTOST_02029 [Ostertagia ostertagi]
MHLDHGALAENPIVLIAYVFIYELFIVVYERHRLQPDTSLHLDIFDMSQKEYISEYYNSCSSTIDEILLQDEQSKVEQDFDNYWVEKRGEALLQEAEYIGRQLEKRLVELECQEAIMKQYIAKTTGQRSSIPTSHQMNFNSAGTQAHLVTPPVAPPLGYMLGRRLLGNELKIPQFNEFGPFWELFEELVHKQPYSNIEKLSILLNSCKGDAARALQKIPRLYHSQERSNLIRNNVMSESEQAKRPELNAMTESAVEKTSTPQPDTSDQVSTINKKITQLQVRTLDIAPIKDKVENLHGMMVKINDRLDRLEDLIGDTYNRLSMSSTCRTINIQAIIVTIRNKENSDSTYITTMVIETFPRNIREETARKESDNGTEWTINDLMDNLTNIIKRKDHIIGVSIYVNNTLSSTQELENQPQSVALDVAPLTTLTLAKNLKTENTILKLSAHAGNT